MLNLGQVKFLGLNHYVGPFNRYERDVQPVPLFLTGYSSLTDISSYVSVIIKPSGSCRLSACGTSKSSFSGDWHSCAVGWQFY